MNNYKFLRQYVYKDWASSETDENNTQGHVFLLFSKEDLEDIKKIENEMGISYPVQLLNLYSEIGIGHLYSKFRDSYISRYRFLEPYEILALYIEEHDVDEEFGGSRVGAIYELEKNNLLSFIEASEHDFFEISLDDESIWWLGSKIANSLEEFLMKVLKEPDYHFKGIQMKEWIQ